MFRRFFISAGDFSGNLIGAKVIELLLEKYPEALFEGIGGDEMSALGHTSMSSIHNTAVSGFSSVIKRYPFFRRLLKESQIRLTKNHYDVVILIDFSGFNMHLLRFCKEHKIKVYYIAPPQVWAWKKRRLKEFAGVHVQTVFEFENKLFDDAGAFVHFCGHPVYDRVQTSIEPMENDLIALLPGSRKEVIKKNFEAFRYVARMLQSDQDSSPKIVVLLPPYLADDPELKALIRGFKISSEIAYTLHKAHFAIAVPGSNNMELLAAQIPSVIVYHASCFNYILSRLFVRVPYVSGVNIIAGKEIFPELVYCRKATLKKFVSFAVRKILADEQKIASELKNLSHHMGTGGFAQLAADTIGELVDGQL